ncbi:response regulator [Azospirillum halopraeferens]|uniref:response regulator n=1 Tax=Azospirillum halopraeferens TaxID=34010 RepID=UPI000A036802|nr:response regulator [Azospirillum halopraeferens]
MVVRSVQHDRNGDRAEHGRRGPRVLRVIVVEDDARMALAIRDTVEDLGHTVCGVAGTEAEAFALAGRERPDVALMDVRLGGDGDGIATARHLSAGFGVRSIFLSGSADHATMRRITETYPLGIIHKPFSTARLKAVLDLAARRVRPAIA